MGDAIQIDIDEDFLFQGLVFLLRSFLAAGISHPLRKALLFELKAESVMARVGEIGEALLEAQRKKHLGVYSDGNAGIALFHAAQRHPARRRPFGQNRRGDPAPAAGVADVLAQLAEGVRHWDW
jgi:hypothetical protein